MTKEVTIYKRQEVEGREGFKIKVSDPVEIGDDNLVLFMAETVEEGVESMTYSRLTPEEMVALGYKLIAAGEMFKKGTKIDVEA